MRIATTALQFIERGIPPSLREDPETHRSAKLFVFLALFLPAFAPIGSLLLYLFAAPAPLVLTPMFTAAIAMSSIMVLRRTASLAFAGNLFMMCFFTNLTVLILYLGGLSSPAAPFLCLFPVAITYFAGIKSGIIWLFIAEAENIALFVLHRADIKFPVLLKTPGSIESFRFLALTILVINIATAVFVYQKVRDEFLELARQKARELEKLNAVIIEQHQKALTSSKMAALGEMAGGIAHEINTPLAVIQSSAQLLELMERSQKLDLAALHKSTQLIVSTVNRISMIVKGLAAFSREAGHDPMEKSELGQIIQGSLNLCYEKFRQHGVRIDVLQTEQEAIVMGRPIELSQVLINLLNNSYDAVSALSEKWIKIELSTEQREAVLSVTDSGKGIRPEIADRIFEPFFTTKAIGKGTGLGLSISQGIVESHHGKIYLDRMDPHTRFVIRLPLA